LVFLEALAVIYSTFVNKLQLRLFIEKPLF
jgi:hypothetical protein